MLLRPPGVLLCCLTALAAADCTGLRITAGQPLAPDGAWEGWAVHDLLPLRLEASWGDGTADPACTRAAAPEWRCDLGWFEGPRQGLDLLSMRVAAAAERRRSATGALAEWTSPLGEGGQGAITVRYAGREARLPLRLRQPGRDGRLPAMFFSEAVLPEPAWMGDLVKALLAPRWGVGGETARLLDLPPAQQRAEDEANREAARAVSLRLEGFVRAWHTGDRSERALPEGLLPAGLQSWKTPWVICRPEAVPAEEQWACRPAYEPPADHSAHYFLYPDPHVTYLKALFVAPFGSRLLVDGDFPHCRFFDLQCSPPTDPAAPMSIGYGGAEVPIVDADLEPEPGSVNPFRVGADRSAAQRAWKARFELEQGDLVRLNEGRFPGSMSETPGSAYRARGNLRVGGPFRATGNLNAGAFLPGYLWVRYYAPDHAAGPLAGVRVPRLALELATGERFWLKPAHRAWVRRQVLAVPVPATRSGPLQPTAAADQGWQKGFGILLQLLEAGARALPESFSGQTVEARRTLVRRLDAVLTRRGADQGHPGDLEPSATCCTYISYLGRRLHCPPGSVLALTGRLPRCPATRGGEAAMAGGELRYFSITRYVHLGRDRTANLFPGLCAGSLMDDEIATDAEGWYCVAFSRPQDCPANARPEAGVTWQDWGPAGEQGATLRWLAVGPEWRAPWAPDSANLPWARTAWSAAAYDQTLIGRNRRDGVLGERLPSLHLFSSAGFARLGARIDPRSLPPGDGW